jgi:broad specificity phosphatase PhoE
VLRVVVCLAKTTPILVVSHLSTLQVLFGYFVGCPVDSFATLSLPRHTVVQLTPNQYGWQVDLIPLHSLDGSASPADHQQRYHHQQQQHPFYGRTDVSDGSAKREHDAPRATAEGEGSLV